MDNPFRFSGVVQEPAFCNREKEVSDLKQMVDSSQNVLLYSHRRYGKTSLILKLFRELKSLKPIYIDLYGTTRPEDFIASLLSGLCTLESKTDRLMKRIRNGIMSINVHFGVDPVTGLPSLSPVFNRGVEERTINECFALVESYAKKTRRVVAFDEFQEVGAYGEAAFEKQLRKSIQRHDRIAYIFAGSQRHLLMDMFNDSKRAFYQQAAGYPLTKIETSHYVEWIHALYRSAKKAIEDHIIEDVVKRCHNHPRYVQEFFHGLWPHDRIDMTLIYQTERDVITKRIPEFAYTWDTLSLNQKRTLKLLAGTAGKNIFSADNLARFGFHGASQVSAALSALERMGVTDKNSVWNIQDPFFEKWLLLNIGHVQPVDYRRR